MNTTAKTPVDSIVIPKHFVDICDNWYNDEDEDDLIYAVSSTGNLTTGNRRPSGCDSEEKWYVFLWSKLANNVECAVRDAKQGFNVAANGDGGDGDGHDVDYSLLVEFETYVNEIVDRLSVEYGLDD